MIDYPAQAQLDITNEMQFCIVLNYMFVDVYANYTVMIHTTEYKINLSYFHYQVQHQHARSSGALHVNKQRCANGVVVCLTLSWWDGTKGPPVSAY